MTATIPNFFSGCPGDFADCHLTRPCCLQLETVENLRKNPFFLFFSQNANNRASVCHAHVALTRRFEKKKKKSICKVTESVHPQDEASQFSVLSPRLFSSLLQLVMGRLRNQVEHCGLNLGNGTPLLLDLLCSFLLTMENYCLK